MRLARLKEIRRAQALSMRALAERSGVTPTTIVRAERGLPVYSVTARRLARALGVTPSDLQGVPPPLPAPDERRSLMLGRLAADAERARQSGDDARAARLTSELAGLAGSDDPLD